jgi:hypothetical protein
MVQEHATNLVLAYEEISIISRINTAICTAVAVAGCNNR